MSKNAYSKGPAFGIKWQQQNCSKNIFPKGLFSVFLTKLLKTLCVFLV
jgi:hypothetical protein